MSQTILSRFESPCKVFLAEEYGEPYALFSIKTDAEDYVKYFGSINGYVETMIVDDDDCMKILSAARELEQKGLKRYRISVPLDGSKLPEHYDPGSSMIEEMFPASTSETSPEVCDVELQDDSGNRYILKCAKMIVLAHDKNQAWTIAKKKVEDMSRVGNISSQ